MQDQKLCIKCGRHPAVGLFNKLCSSCNIETYNCGIKENLINNENTETSGESDVFCPYCGEIQINDEGQFSEEGTENVYCGDCGKEFELETEVSYSYSTKRI